jgi:hypothetical protein
MVFMKRISLVLLIGSLLVAYSCKRSNTEVRSVTTDVKGNNKGGIQHTPKDTTITLECVKLTVKVVDEKNENMKDCKVALNIAGPMGDIEETRFRWNLPNRGDTSVTFHTQGTTATVQVYNKSEFRASYNFPNGITENTRLVFVLKNYKN